MIGIIGAMEIEVESLKSKLTDVVCESVGSVDYFVGKMYGKDVVVAKCGVGKVFAAICAQTMILKYSPALIINTGVAGSLSENLGVLDVAVASGVIQHDMDTSAIGDPVGLISGINMVNIPADKDASFDIAICIKKLGLHTIRGAIASGDQFIGSEGAKNKIIENFPECVACEMEGAAIGQTCYVSKVPFAVIRAISDNANSNGHLDFPTFAKLAAQNSTKALELFLKEYGYKY